jgi:uncharacterized RDD family membrane protein YckC
VERIDTTATIDTPERVRFRYRLAGPGQRAAAWSLDTLIRLILLLGVSIFVAAMSAIPGLKGVSNGLLLVFMFMITWFYGTLFEAFMGGRTPGKLVFNLRVVRDDGAPARFQDCLLRNLLWVVDFMPMLFGLGVLVAMVDRRMRRIGDLVAGTVVMAEDPTRILGGVEITPPVTEEERRSMPPRIDLSRDEVLVVENLLRRRNRLSKDRVEELAGMIGPGLLERTGFRADTWERTVTLAYARATGKDR